MTDLPMIVKVKPLVWEAGARDQRRADSIVGEFCVTFFGGRWFYKGEPRGGMLAAQAAAQADYEARILAALDLTPDPRVTALVEACMAWGMHIAPEDATAADPFRDIRAALAAFKGGTDA